MDQDAVERFRRRKIVEAAFQRMVDNQTFPPEVLNLPWAGQLLLFHRCLKAIHGEFTAPKEMQPEQVRRDIERMDPDSYAVNGAATEHLLRLIEECHRDEGGTTTAP